MGNFLGDFVAVQKPLPTEEELNNMDEESRQQFISDYYKGAFAHAGVKPKFRHKILHRFSGLIVLVGSLLVIALLYGLINVLFVGGQKIWHSGDNKKLTKIEEQLKDEEKRIKQYELEITIGSITDYEYEKYKEVIDDYNANVKEYNKLAEKVGTTYYVIPGLGRR